MITVLYALMFLMLSAIPAGACPWLFESWCPPKVTSEVAEPIKIAAVKKRYKKRYRRGYRSRSSYRRSYRRRSRRATIPMPPPAPMREPEITVAQEPTYDPYFDTVFMQMDYMNRRNRIINQMRRNEAAQEKKTVKAEPPPSLYPMVSFFLAILLLVSLAWWCVRCLYRNVATPYQWRGLTRSTRHTLRRILRQPTNV